MTWPTFACGKDQSFPFLAAKTEAKNRGPQESELVFWGGVLPAGRLKQDYQIAKDTRCCGTPVCRVKIATDFKYFYQVLANDSSIVGDLLISLSTFVLDKLQSILFLIPPVIGTMYSYG